MFTKVIAAEDAQTKMPELLIMIAQGYEIIIEKNSEPFAKLTAIAKPKNIRTPGLNRGDIWTSEDFDEPLADDFWHCEQ